MARLLFLSAYQFWELSLERVRVSNEKEMEVNIYCTAIRNYFIGHTSIVMGLSWLNQRAITVVIA